MDKPLQVKCTQAKVEGPGQSFPLAHSGRKNKPQENPLEICEK